MESNGMIRGSSIVKRGFAHMLKNGVVMDVTTVEQAKIAEKAGAVSVMVLDKLLFYAAVPLQVSERRLRNRIVPFPNVAQLISWR